MEVGFSSYSEDKVSGTSAFMSSCRFSCSEPIFYPGSSELPAPEQPLPSFCVSGSGERRIGGSQVMTQMGNRPREASSKKKSTYKHVPHRDKPQHLVQRRNARERRRVQAVNGAFQRLRRLIPFENKHKRISKVKTLKLAMDYIDQLQALIQEHDLQLQNSMCGGGVVIQHDPPVHYQMTEQEAPNPRDCRYAWVQYNTVSKQPV